MHMQESLEIPTATTFHTRRAPSYRKRQQFVTEFCKTFAEDGATINWSGDIVVIHNSTDRISIVFEIVNKDGRE